MRHVEVGGKLINWLLGWEDGSFESTSVESFEFSGDVSGELLGSHLGRGGGLLGVLLDGLLFLWG